MDPAASKLGLGTLEKKQFKASINYACTRRLTLYLTSSANRLIDQVEVRTTSLARALRFDSTAGELVQTN